MTISSDLRIAGPFSGNDVADEFTFDFKIFEDENLRVIYKAAAAAEVDYVEDTDYTVVMNADQNNDPGGTITLVGGPLATGDKLAITSDLEALQGVDITNGGGFYPEVVESEFDYLTILIQQLEEQMARTFKVSITSGITPGDLEDLLDGIVVNITDTDEFTVHNTFVVEGESTFEGPVTFLDTVLFDATSDVTFEGDVVFTGTVNLPTGSVTSDDILDGTILLQDLNSEVLNFFSSAAGGTASSVTGLVASNTDNLMTVNASTIVVQNPDTGAVTVLQAPAEKTINIETAGVTAGGRDQAGAFTAETWVHFYYIYNTSGGGTLAGIASAAAPTVGPTFPTGYTRWAYIGAIFLDATSDLLHMTAYGNNFFYDAAPFTLAAGTAATSTAVDLSEVIPPNCTEWQCILRINVAGGGGAGNDWLMAAGVDSSAVTAGFGSVFVDQGVPAAYPVSIQGYNSAVQPNVGQNVYYRVYLLDGSTGQGYANLMVPSFKVRN